MSSPGQAQSILNQMVAQVKKDVDPLIKFVEKRLREENEEQAERFLKAHEDFCLQDLSPVLKETTGMETSSATVRLRPSVCGTDGFFAASFLKR